MNQEHGKKRRYGLSTVIILLLLTVFAIFGAGYLFGIDEYPGGDAFLALTTLFFLLEQGLFLLVEHRAIYKQSSML